MVSAPGNSGFAFAFLFDILSVNLRLAQKVREPQPNPGEKMVPNGDGTASSVPVADNEARPTGGAVVTGNGINYNGGPVLKGNPVPIYLIWYGNWNGTGSNTPVPSTPRDHAVHTPPTTPHQLNNPPPRTTT